MSLSFEEFLAIFDLEPIEVNIFRGVQSTEESQRVFGGQVIAQALVAAQRTVAMDRTAHSLHGYFMRPGDPKIPILYEVDRIRDGRSFTTRRVVAIQHGQAIFSASVSFQIAEEGLNHQWPMPDVPPPESLKSDVDRLREMAGRLPEDMRSWLDRPRPLEMRPVDPQNFLSTEKMKPIQQVWVKTVDKLPDDARLHAAIMAYASDLSLLLTGARVHGLSLPRKTVQLASLDHAIWFHQPFRCDDWLLYAQDSPFTGGARSFNRGLIYSRDGTLVASVAQEGLMREFDPALARK